MLSFLSFVTVMRLLDAFIFFKVLGLVLSVTLNCESVEEYSWTFYTGDRCVVRSDLIITEPNQIVTSISIKSETNFPNPEKLIMLDIANTVVKYFPQGIEKFHPLLEGFAMSGSRLKVIARRDIAAFRKLKALWLHYNDLETLDSDLFMSNPGLFYIDFRGNKLKFVGEALLDLMPQLQIARFESNDCIDIQAATSAEVPTLQSVLRMKCVHMKEKYCKDDVGILKKSVASLEFENQKQKEKLENLENEVEALKISKSEISKENQKNSEKLRETIAQNNRLKSISKSCLANLQEITIAEK